MWPNQCRIQLEIYRNIIYISISFTSTDAVKDHVGILVAKQICWLILALPTSKNLGSLLLYVCGWTQKKNKLADTQRSMMIGSCPWLSFPWQILVKWRWKLVVITSLHYFNSVSFTVPFSTWPQVSLQMSSHGLQRNINITFQHFHCHCFASWSSVNAKRTSLYHFTIGTMTKNFAWESKKWK